MWRVVEEYIEPGKSGTSMDKRPAFHAMPERIRTQRDISCVIVYKLSRMNRNRVDDALVLTSLRKYKTTLVSATESIDETPVGQLMHGILAAFNEFRSAEDGADIRYKMGEKAKRGGTLGRAKLGYLNVRERFEGREVRTVVTDPERVPFITRATGRRGTDYFYYLCRGRQEGVCDLPYLPTEHVEDAVLQYWASQRLSEGFIGRVRENVQATLAETTASARLLREQLKARPADSDDRLAQGAAVLEAQLVLLQPSSAYRQLSDYGRRLLNQAMLEELLIDREDATVQVVGQTYTEPVRRPHAGRPGAPRSVNSGFGAKHARLAANGEPAGDTLAALLPPLFGRGLE